MIKKKPKLSLNRETIRQLTMDELGKVAAGGYTDLRRTDITCGASCPTLPGSRCPYCD